MDLPAELLAGFGLTRGVPSERTIRRLVEGCDPAGLDEALSGWIARAGDDPAPGPRGLAFDGKTLKGARSFTETGAMSQEAVVEAVYHGTGITAGHQRVIGGDEIAAVEALAGRLDLTDVLVTTDSLHSHERLARKIRARHGHWLLVIKLNQPTVSWVHSPLPATPRPRCASARRPAENHPTVFDRCARVRLPACRGFSLPMIRSQDTVSAAR